MEAQAPVQAFLRPSMWFCGVRNLHMFKEIWQIPNATPEKCVQSLANTVKKLQNTESTGSLEVHKIDKEGGFIQIYSYTNTCGWLDVVEVQFRPARESGTEASALSFSSGLFPVTVPLSFVWNIIFFWAPFSGNGFNKKRLHSLRTNMDIPNITVEPVCGC